MMLYCDTIIGTTEQRSGMFTASHFYKAETVTGGFEVTDNHGYVRYVCKDTMRFVVDNDSTWNNPNSLNFAYFKFMQGH